MKLPLNGQLSSNWQWLTQDKPHDAGALMFLFDMMDGWRSDNGKYPDISHARITTSLMMYFSNLTMMRARLNDASCTQVQWTTCDPVERRKDRRKQKSEQGRVEEVQSVRWLFAEVWSYP